MACRMLIKRYLIILKRGGGEESQLDCCLELTLRQSDIRARLVLQKNSFYNTKSNSCSSIYPVIIHPIQ